MSDLLHRQIAQLREQLEERDETIRQLQAQLSEEAPLPRWLPRLSVTEEAVFRVLWKRGQISREKLTALMNEDVADPENHGKVYILKLRRKLDPIGIAIKTDWGRGYYLDDASVERLRSAA